MYLSTIPARVAALSGYNRPIVVSTDTVDYGDDAYLVHRAKVSSLAAACRNGELDEWRFSYPPSSVPNPGRRYNWRWAGCGEILRHTTYQLTAEDREAISCLTYDSQRDGTITADTTPDNLGRSLTKAEENRRDNLRRNVATEAGFKTWKEYVKSTMGDPDTGRPNHSTIAQYGESVIHPGKGGPPCRFTYDHHSA